MTGRPSGYTDEIGQAICDRLIEGESLRHICEDERMPSKSMVLRWAQNNPIFRDHYARAMSLSGDGDADDIAHYSRQAARGEIDASAATAAINGLKWTSARKNPKKYGDKVALVGGDPEQDNPVQITDLDRAKAVAALVAKAKG